MAIMNSACLQVTGAKETYDLSSLRTNPSTSFGITLTKELADKWREFTGGCQLYEASYGLSESHAIDACMPRDAVRWGTQGKIPPGVECRIVDPTTGGILPAGKMGEIVTRSDGVFKGYWNRPKETQTTLRDGWLYTGDMGRLDDDGYLTFCGRIKEMIKVSGYSVFPEEVETILIKHPAVLQAAVVGIPDDKKGQAVKAVLVLRPGMKANADQIVAWARDNMSAYKAPKVVEFRDSLPATGAGKVLRRLLQAP
jgi:long-chain acyl-CoA synthetase